MSVVNKMLKDLDNRAAHEDGDGSDYREPSESKRIRYMIIFIALVGVSAASYFSYRAVGPEYFLDLYAQAKQIVSGEEPKQQQSKKVSVNSALDQMMPTRGNSTSKETEEKVETAKAGTSPEASIESDNSESTTDNAQVAQEVAEVSQAPETETSRESSEAGAEAVSQQAVNIPVPNLNNVVPGQTLVPGQTDDSFVQVTNTDSADAQISELTSLAAQAVAENNVSRAIEIYRQILNIDFKQHEIRKKLAVLQYSNGNNGAASVVLSDGISIAPQRVDFRLMLARLFYREKKLRAAYTVLEGVEPDVQRNIDFYGLKATVAQELELNAESSHLYGRLVIFEPNRAQWWLGLAISLDRMSQRDGALKAYENAADLRQLSASANDFIRQRILELGG
ncbi:hypothetical protein [Planctobacterium marinum]|uniref:MSHA biogenesis protein MshN n=1 Tax=Planctobacterium marinum TaxID=1631968 RepID=A0AA48I8Y2_9ALTE|nr:hypothetical protein MACH26_36510 [Planctobacterium marinum]